MKQLSLKKYFQPKIVSYQIKKKTHSKKLIQTTLNKYLIKKYLFETTDYFL